MPQHRSTLIISFGSSHLAAARFYLNASQNLVLEEYASRDLNFDFSRQDEWLPAIADAAGELLKSKLWSGNADIIAPVYPLFLKKIKAPVVEKSRQSAVIAYEAEQNVPYEISGLAWDRQVVGGDGFDLEVMLLACQLEIAEEICRCASSMGLRPLSLRSDCLSEHCALRHSLPKNSRNTLLLKIGARSTSFLFPKAKGLGLYFRSIPIGGNTLTAAIAEKLGISLAEAEKVKRQTPPSSPSPESDVIHAQRQKFMRRLSLETSRSLDHFKRQDGDARAEKILLSDRGALLPGLTDSLKDKFSLTVDFFQPLEGIQIGENVDAVRLKRDELRLGALVGQARATLLPNTKVIDLNVLPPRIVRQRSFQRARPYLLAAACFLGTALYLPLAHFQNNSSIYRQQIEALEQELLPTKIFHEDLAATLDRIEEIEQKVSSLEPLMEAKGNWLAFLADFQMRLVEVEDVWFDEMQILRDENENQGGVSGLRLHLAGRMLDRENPLARVSANIQQRVNQLLGAFGESEFVSEVTNRKFDASGRGLLLFQFTLVLNPQYHL